MFEIVLVVGVFLTMVGLVMEPHGPDLLVFLVGMVGIVVYLLRPTVWEASVPYLRAAWQKAPRKTLGMLGLALVALLCAQAVSYFQITLLTGVMWMVTALLLVVASIFSRSKE